MKNQQTSYLSKVCFQSSDQDQVTTSLLKININFRDFQFHLDIFTLIVCLFLQRSSHSNKNKVHLERKTLHLMNSESILHRH